MNSDEVLLFVIKWLGATALIVWLVFRFLKAVIREYWDFQDWLSEARRARDARKAVPSTHHAALGDS